MFVEYVETLVNTEFKQTTFILQTSLQSIKTTAKLLNQTGAPFVLALKQQQTQNFQIPLL